MSKRKTTADLIVRHTEAHLARRRKQRYPLESSHSFGTLPIVLAAFAVLLLAWNLVNFSLPSESETPAFIANDAEDYTSQQNFYTGQSIATTTSDYSEAVGAVHAAASAKEKSDIVNAAGFLLIIFAMWYLHHEHNLFRLGDKPRFKVRKIN